MSASISSERLQGVGYRLLELLVSHRPTPDLRGSDLHYQNLASTDARPDVYSLQVYCSQHVTRECGLARLWPVE